MTPTDTAGPKPPDGLGRRQWAAAAPAETPPFEASQERNAIDTAATIDVPFESAPTEKTPGPAGGTTVAYSRFQRPGGGTGSGQTSIPAMLWGERGFARYSPK
ncbi:hypothetical protein NDU88_001873 [Pleurodeles waltl]|uniref:Uncharacterized protein n=1 Tax=Pleurodeles waltl TaxID=8319 RepID=A0AAV7QB36_PLEWA|nr:hypothetical protein NDU88_001873 [Pleurodeles waltl]